MGNLRAHAHSTGRLPADGDVFRVSAEGGDVAFHPLRAELLIQEAEIRRALRGFRGELGMRQEAEYVEPVVDGDDDRAAPCDALAVKLHLGSRAHLQPAAEIPYEHRKPGLALRGSPDIQVKAIFAHVRVVVHRPFAGIDVVLSFPVTACGVMGPKS